MPKKGYKATKEHRQKLSIIRKKNPNRYWFGKKFSEEHIERMRESHREHKHSEETKRKLSKIMRGNPKCGWNKGLHFSEEVRQKIKIGLIKSWDRRGRTGQLRPYEHPDTAEHKSWKKAVFERDNYTCQNCTKRGGELQANHIKRWALYPKLRFILSNGMTMCIECHKLIRGLEKQLEIIYGALYN